MSDFFKGWRRKFGVVTLGLACLFAVGWVRSRIEFDEYNHYSDSGMVKLFATEGRLGSFRYIAETKNDFRYALSVASNDILVGVYIGKTPSQIAQRWEIIGFHFQTGQVGNKIRYVVYTIPYWSFTIPTTLLAAWLLLSRPRKKPVAAIQ